MKSTLAFLACMTFSSIAMAVQAVPFKACGGNSPAKPSATIAITGRGTFQITVTDNGMPHLLDDCTITADERQVSSISCKSNTSDATTAELASTDGVLNMIEITTPNSTSPVRLFCGSL